jgi:hypothetical protein
MAVQMEAGAIYQAELACLQSPSMFGSGQRLCFLRRQGSHSCQDRIALIYLHRYVKYTVVRCQDRQKNNSIS